jgi:hypothetical protein
MNNQKFLKLARDRAKVKAGECHGCEDGKVYGNCLKNHSCIDCHIDINTCEWVIPCPTCAELREIAEWCWHDFIKCDDSDCPKCSICKEVFWIREPINPTFTVQTIRHTLEVLGEWEGFVLDKGMPLLTRANILTSDELCLEAAIEYLEGHVKGGE